MYDVDTAKDRRHASASLIKERFDMDVIGHLPVCNEQSDAASSTAVSKETRRRVRQAIVQDLSMQERLLLLLAYAERMNPSEIAATLNMAPSQVDAAKERVVARLETVMRAA